MDGESEPVEADPVPTRVLLREESWHPIDRRGARRRRAVRRLMVVSLLLGLLVVLAVLVLRPFAHPRVRLLTVAPEAAAAPERLLLVWPVSQDGDDAARLRRLADAMGGPAGEEPAEAVPLAEQLRALAADSSTVQIVSLTGQGVADGRELRLVRTIVPEAAGEGIDLDEALRQLAASPARLKLLILDGGHLTADPRAGRLVSEFPRRLRQAVRATGDRRLWVLMSHSEMEQSHVRPRGRTSVFQHFVARGLSGEADIDQNRVIDLAELHRYVVGHVAAQVHHQTDGTATQTPQLVWGGGTGPATPFAEALVPVLDPARTDDASAAVGTPESASSEAPAADDTATTAAASASTATGATSAASETAASATQDHAAAGATAADSDSPRKPAGIDSTPQAARNAPKNGASKTDAPATSDGAAVAASAAGEATVSQDAAADGGEPSDQPLADAGGAAAASSSPVASVPPSGGDETTERVAALLREAWALRDWLERRHRPEGSPVDDAPHLWREFERELLLLELHHRSGVAEETVRAVLVPRLRALRRLARGERPPFGKPENVVERIAAAVPREAPSPMPPYSLAMAERRAALTGRPPSADVQAATAALDRLIAGGQPQEFAQWLAKASPTVRRYAEIRRTALLAAVPDGDAALLRQTAETIRLGERVAAGCGACLPWVRARLAVADRLRLDGERELIDRIGPEWHARSRQRLERAAAEYRAADEAARAILAADHLSRDVLHRLPAYLAWHRHTGGAPNLPGPRADALRQAMAALTALHEVRRSADPARLEELNQRTATLRALVEPIEGSLQEPRLAALTAPPLTAGTAYQVDLLLSNPLPRATSRTRLLEALAGGMSSGFEPNTPDRDLRPRTGATAADWLRVLAQARLEAQYVGLAALASSDNSPLVSAVESRLMALEAAVAQWRHEATPPNEDALWTAARDFGRSLREFYDGLPGRIEALLRGADRAEPTPEVLERAAAADHLLRLLDPRDASRVGPVMPAGLLQRGEWIALLAWQQERTTAALADAPAAEREYLTQLLRDARAVSPQPGGREKSAAAVLIDGPASLMLVPDPQGVLPLTVRSRGNTPTPAWVLLDYDPELLDVRCDPDATVYFEDQLREDLRERSKLATATTKPDTAAARAAEYPLRPDLADLPPTLRLTPGNAAELRLAVRGRGASARPARLVVKIIAGGEYVRHAADVHLASFDAVDLVVAGLPGTWTRHEDGLTLQTLPNRRTDYLFSVTNRSDAPRQVDVAFVSPGTVLPAGLPSGALPGDRADVLLAEFQPLLPLASVSDLTVPPGETVPLPFPAPPPAEAPPPAADAKAAPPKEEAEAKDEPTGVAGFDQLTPLPNGLLCIITDRGSGRKTVRPIRFAPQRPRRYVRADVAYNRREERIEIRVGMQNPSLFPPDGVTVRAELAEGSFEGTEAILEGRIEQPDGEAHLRIGVPEEFGRTVTLHLHVDEYPRAFIYRVECDRDADHLPEARGLHVVRLRPADDGGPYRVGTPSVPVVLEVDAPVGSFESGTDYVDVGVDQNRDRELWGEPVRRVTRDRQAEVALKQFAPGGQGAFVARVGDHRLDLPAAGVRNARVELLAQSVVKGQSAWSHPIEAIFDGSAPRLEGPRTNPADGTVLLGDDLLVSVLAADGNLSGIAKVEGAFDRSRTGKFGEGAAPLPGLPAGEGRWVVKLPTADLKPGPQTVLLRATDRVDHESDYLKLRVRIVTPEEVARQKAAQTNSVSGSVLQGYDPVPGVTVSIAPPEPKEKPPAGAKPPEPPPKIPDVTTDDQGKFVFPKVPVGPYVVKAGAVVKNRKRTATAPVVVVPPPARVEPLQLKLQ